MLEKHSIKVGASFNPYSKVIQSDKRHGLIDRRKLITFLSNDRRNGLSDRRNPTEHRYRRLKVSVSDRRQLNTYVAKDRRSGIVDRRNTKRFIQSFC